MKDKKGLGMDCAAGKETQFYGLFIKSVSAIAEKKIDFMPFCNLL